MDPSQTVTLNRLLSRLDQSLLSPASDARLRTSQYERNRVSVNIEHARTLLLTLEKQSSTVRIQSQRQQIQTDLQQKRDLVKRLNARLQELNELDRGSDNSSSDDDDDDEDGEDLLKEYAPARLDVDAGIEASDSHGAKTIDADPPPTAQNEPPSLRSRKNLSAADNRSAASTSARENLFAGRKQNPELETTESLMTHNRTEQENLTNGLLSLARALKESSVDFGTSLEQEKDVLKRAEGGLEKSSLGMEAAERRMGMLRRMSEGQGWWGRIKLYGFIFGLWIACFLLVFVGPKLRL